MKTVKPSNVYLNVKYPTNDENKTKQNIVAIITPESRNRYAIENIWALEFVYIVSTTKGLKTLFRFRDIFVESKTIRSTSERNSTKKINQNLISPPLPTYLHKVLNHKKNTKKAKQITLSRLVKKGASFGIFEVGIMPPSTF